MIQVPDSPVCDDALAASVCELAMAMFDVEGALLTLRGGVRKGIAGIAAHLPERLIFHARDLTAGLGLVVADASRDRRYFFDPIVLAAPGVRFYADMPLMIGGEAIGVLALIGATPDHDFDERRRGLLARLAALATGMLALAKDARDRTALNTTLQAALRMQTTRLDQAARAAQFGYWTIDLATRDLYWSDGLFALHGLNPQTFKPSLTSHFDLYGDQAEDVLLQVQTAVAAGEDFDFTTTIVRVDDGRSRHLHVRGGIERDPAGQPVRLCAVVCDVSDRVIREPQSAASAPPRDDVLRRFSDELRHPLHDILDMARAVGGAETTMPDVAAFSDSLRRDAEILSRLAPEDEIADDHSVDLTPSVVAPVVLADVLRAVAAPFSARALLRDTRLSLHFVDWRYAQGQVDAVRLQRVLHGLLDHACAVARGGLISVTASQVQAENATSGALETRLHVVVRESGSGVGDAHAQALLAGEGGRNGLSDARGLIEAMGGDIGVYAHPNDGMRIWFEIPVVWVRTETPRPRHLAPDSVRADVAPAIRAPTPATRAPDASSPHGRHINREYLRALLQDMKLGLN